jgi:hypothetical protein
MGNADGHPGAFEHGFRANRVISNFNQITAQQQQDLLNFLHSL